MASERPPALWARGRGSGTGSFFGAGSLFGAVEGASPSWQVSAVQRTLNQAGYGPIKVSGVLDDTTREGIARFERDHNLPVTGQNTARVRHALSAVTGRSLD